MAELRSVKREKVDEILAKIGYQLESEQQPPAPVKQPEKQDTKAPTNSAQAPVDTSLKQDECGCNQRMSAAEDTSKKIDETKVATTSQSSPAAAAPAAAPATSTATASKENSGAAAASASPAVNIDMAPIASAISEGFKNSQQLVLDQLTKQLGVQEKKQESAVIPSSRVDDSAAKAKTESFNKMKEWFIAAAKRGSNVGPQHEWTVSKDDILRKYTGVGYDGIVQNRDKRTYKQVETVTVTGGDMPQRFDNQIHRIPGGRLPLNIRPYANFVDLTNQDRANWYKIDGTTVYTITEGTEPTQSAQTVTKITATPSIRGVYDRVGYSQVENAPFDLVQGVQDHMSLSLIDDEASDMLGTVYDAVSPTN